MSDFQKLLSKVREEVGPHPDVEEGGLPEDLAKMVHLETIDDVEEYLISPETGWDSREDFHSSTGTQLEDLVGSYAEDDKGDWPHEPPSGDTLQEVENGVRVLQIVHNRTYLEDFQAWKDQEGTVWVDQDKLG